ncbi:MAG: Glycerol-phosphate dehydrogenase [Verrucomicrobiales bacterium]|nr:Glycerol-phosphate dehydrogenase [Verrucomicrobiales bacterium]
MIPSRLVLSSAQALEAARETQVLEIGSGILSQVPEIFRGQFGNRPAVMVTDPNTFSAAGSLIRQAFADAGHLMREPFLFHDPDLYAERRFVDELRTALAGHDAVPVAVGAGTLNDLTKLASHEAGHPYLCVATAAFMDGYTAYGASITHRGSKQTFDCSAPVAVVADLAVIAAAPPAMNAWGYADLLAKVTAGADWIVADFLGMEPIEPLSWTSCRAVGDPDGIRRADPDAIARLVEGLMLGGFAMQAKGMKLEHSGWMVAGFEISGVVGMLAAGWITDRVFGGRGAWTCLVYMALAGAAMFCFWKTPVGYGALSAALLCAAGFFIYGPQALIGIAVANLATKRAAAGFTGIFGYASTLVFGVGLGWLVEKHGWNAAFDALILCSAIGTALFALSWRARVHGYAEHEASARAGAGCRQRLGE